jgi:hypothetical protein
VHQATDSPGIFDVAFDSGLAAEFLRSQDIPVPVLRVAQGGGRTTLTWEGGGWRLEAAAEVSGTWSPVDTTDNQYVVSSIGTETRRFFRLVTP